MALSIAPTRSVDLLEAVRFDGRGPAVRGRRHFARFVRQVADSTAVTLRTEAGALVCVIGVAPLDEDQAEVWFAVGPGIEGRLLRTLRAVRDVGESVVPILSPVTLIARIHPMSVAGGRLASWFGLERTGEEPSPFGPIAIWTRSF